MCFTIGYAIPAGTRLAARRSADTRPRFDESRLIAGSVVAALVGLMLYAGFLAAWEDLRPCGLFLVGEARRCQPTYIARPCISSTGRTSSAPSALLLGAVAWKRRSRPIGVAAVVIAGILVVPATAIGSRMILLPLALGFVAFRYIRRGRRPGTLALCIGAAIALVGSSVLLQTRDATDRARGSLLATAAQTVSHPARILDPVTKQGDAEMVPAFAAALQVIPAEVPFAHGRAMALDFLTRPVPRQLWPGKPVAPREQIIAHLWPHEYASHIANPEFSVLLSLYLDFGVAGIAFGLAILGILARALYAWFNNRANSLRGQLVFALFAGNLCRCPS